jgi:putative oxidoreductase
MNAIINLGKYLYAIPFGIFGIMHFMNADDMAGMPPFGGSIMVYITGLALVAAAVSIIIGKMDKLASVLLAVLLLLFVFTMHLSGVMSGDEAQMMTSMPNLLKDTALAGAALMYASMAKDDAVIG